MKFAFGAERARGRTLEYNRSYHDSRTSTGTGAPAQGLGRGFATDRRVLRTRQDLCGCGGAPWLLGAAHPDHGCVRVLHGAVRAACGLGADDAPPVRDQFANGADVAGTAGAVSPDGGEVRAHQRVCGRPAGRPPGNAALGGGKGRMSAQVRLKQVFAIICYSGMPGLIMVLLAIAVMFLKPPDDFNLQNPLVFNPGAFMDPTATSKFVYSLASSLDLFRLWQLVLIGIGLKAAAGKTLSMGGAMTAVFLPWAIWILGTAALSGVFTR